MLCRGHKGTPSERRMVANQISIRCGMHIREKFNEDETPEELPAPMTTKEEQEVEKGADDHQVGDSSQKRTLVVGLESI
jgi:hypothetical protein